MIAEHRRTSDAAEEMEETGSVGTRGNGKPAEHHEEGAIIAGIRATDIEPYTGLRCLSKIFRFMGVMMVPGATALTRMPCGARSRAACRVSALIPPLAAA